MHGVVGLRAGSAGPTGVERTSEEAPPLAPAPGPRDGVGRPPPEPPRRLKLARRQAARGLGDPGELDLARASQKVLALP